MGTLLSFTAFVLLSLAAATTRAEEPASGDAARKTPSAQSQAKAKGPWVLDAAPQGYCLHAYDDCGVAERQPHVQMKDSYLYPLPTEATKADLKSRSAVFNWKAVDMLYSELDPTLSYVLAVTYPNDHVYKRVQSLWGNGVQLHEPFAIPKSAAVRLVVKVPQSLTKTGKLALQFRLHGDRQPAGGAGIAAADLLVGLSVRWGRLRLSNRRVLYAEAASADRAATALATTSRLLPTLRTQ
jgi:hypothetical protein